MAYFPPYIDASGIHLPTYEDRLQDLCSAYRTVFGQQAGLSPAVPDCQLLSVFARALDDASAPVLSAYNFHNPAYASTFAVADLSANGPFGTERERIVPQWNQKCWIDSDADVVLEPADGGE